MSVQALSWVFQYSKSSGNDRCVLLAIANRAGHRDGDGVEWCWPSMDRLAEESNCSRRTAQRAVRRLVDLGELEVADDDERRPDGELWGRDDRRTNCFGLSGMRSRGDSLTPRGEPGRGDSRDAYGVTPETPRGDTGDTRTVREPKEETEGRTDPDTDPYPQCSTGQTRTLARSLTRQLAEQVKANGHAIPKAGTSAVGGWLRTMERLVRAGPPGDVEWYDDPSEAADEIGKVAGWACGTSDFWPANVRSPDALARNYTTIRAQWRRDTADDDAWRDNPAYDTTKLVV